MAAIDDTPAPAAPDRSSLVDCRVLPGQQVLRGDHPYSEGEEFEADADEAKDLADKGLVEVVGSARLEPYTATSCSCEHGHDHA